MLRGAKQWLVPYLRSSARRLEVHPDRPLQVFIALCDHFEPLHHTDLQGAKRRVQTWCEQWPAQVNGFHDHSGRGPRHSFFYPIEKYHAELLAPLADLCARTGSEVEVHLHHDNDNAQSLHAKLQQGIDELRSHGLLGQDAQGKTRFAFIHGNWALDNSHPSGRRCGVNDELAVLRQAGCYADMTMPAAPDPCQSHQVNRLYYAREDGRARSQDEGFPCLRGAQQNLRHHPEHLLMVQGPLALNWRWRKWGLLPRLENAEICASNPPSLQRFQLWLKHAPGILNGPPWIFIKLHSHGGIEPNFQVLLGEAMRRFYRELEQFSTEHPGLGIHFVTAREMVNLIHAAEDGHDGPPSAALNHHIAAPPVLAGSSSR